MTTVLSLFAGIGGLDLGLAWAGFTTVGWCERDPFCRRVMGLTCWAKRFAGWRKCRRRWCETKGTKR